MLSKRALGPGPVPILSRTISRQLPFCSRGFRRHRISRITLPRYVPWTLASHTRGYTSPPMGSAADARSPVTRLKNLLLGTAIGASLIVGYYYITDTRASFHQWLVVPLLRWVYPDAEDAHEAGTVALKALYEFGLHPRERTTESGGMEVEVRRSWTRRELLPD